MKLSVAVATFNEEKNLGACLASVKDWTDEMVVVDGGSTDKTVVVAKKYGARVTITDNPPIFHINKQKAIDTCQGQWILQLDADERVSPELKQEILGVIDSKTKFNGFWLPRRNFFLGRYLKKGGQYPDYTLRLYRRGKGRLPCRSVHEQAEVKGKVGYLQNDLLHHADPNFKRYLLRFNRYTDLLATELAEKKLRINLLSAINYFLVKPMAWFFWTYFRHKGFVDSWQGLVFSFFSGLRFAVGYLKYWRQQK